MRSSIESNYQTAIIEISKIIGKQEKLEIYPEIVYSKTKREKYKDQDKIQDALNVRVSSGVSKRDDSISKSSVSLSF